MARILGAPVIEPQGNSAARIRAEVSSGNSRARTRLTIWWTVG